MGKGWNMTRRRFFQAFAAVMVTVCLLVLSGVLSAQGNSDTAFERVKEVQERHTEALMAKEGVVGTAVGLDDDGNPAVLVLLEHGAVAGIPDQLDGVKAKKIVTGEIRALDDKTRYGRPVPIGVSTGNKGECSAGTIACRVTDGSNVYALSNNHVFALENTAPLGSEVLQPGMYDTPCVYYSANVIGTLYNYVPISFSSNNTIDAAIAKTDVGQVGTATPPDGYGTPRSTPVAAALGMLVQKRGRTTGRTLGEITGINVSVRVQYSRGVARFVNQILISPGGFSAAGDSGSLIVTQADNSPVGLLFAGSSSVTIANRIDLVLAQFGVTIDGSGGSVNPPVANFSANRTSGSAPLAVQFTDLSSGSPTSWSWVFGDGGTSTVQNPSHTYNAAGSYTVSLTATNAGGPNTQTKTNYITVTSPGAGVTVTGIAPNTIRAGSSTPVTISGTGFASGAKVTFENGSGPAPTARVLAVGATSITATVTVKSGGPSGTRYWDVRVTNPDGSTGVLVRGFTVTR